ncbi:MAG: aspartate 1-decarboxylase [Candidatus Marinimicrobia bacterium]|nr:aspartate 1-decarboxylase [Candidatus Neomarinimicrobiota bacterium]
MILNLLKSKIHRATVTEADLHYIGSITIDEDLMEAAKLHEYEKVHVLNITNGNRLSTYVIKGTRGSGCIKINGAAAHHVNVNDLIIIVSYCQINSDQVKNHEPSIVHVNSNNEILSIESNELSL